MERYTGESEDEMKYPHYCAVIKDPDLISGVNEYSYLITCLLAKRVEHNGEVNFYTLKNWYEKERGNYYEPIYFKTHDGGTTADWNKAPKNDYGSAQVNKDDGVQRGIFDSKYNCDEHLSYLDKSGNKNCHYDTFLDGSCEECSEVLFMDELYSDYGYNYEIIPYAWWGPTCGNGWCYDYPYWCGNCCDDCPTPAPHTHTPAPPTPAPTPPASTPAPSTPTPASTLPHLTLIPGPFFTPTPASTLPHLTLLPGPLGPSTISPFTSPPGLITHAPFTVKPLPSSPPGLSDKLATFSKRTAAKLPRSVKTTPRPIAPKTKGLGPRGSMPRGGMPSMPRGMPRGMPSGGISRSRGRPGGMSAGRWYA